jgi:hypothetical protein
MMWKGATMLGGAIAGAALAVTPARAVDPSAALPSQVLTEVKADLNGDGVNDRAALLQGTEADDVDLAIYLSANGRPADRPSVYKPAFGWTGAMAGTEPELRVNKAGSLIVVFQNDSIGRDRWRRQFTIAYRDGALVVAGYDYQARDTLEPGHVSACDLNFLTGRGTRNGKPVRLGAGPVRLDVWTEASLPAACKADEER